MEFQSIKEFDDYIKNLSSNLNLDENEREELEEEWRQHLYDHYFALINKNVNKIEAVKIVINQFGNTEMLQNEVNKTFPNSKKNHLQKEVIIAIICIAASIIGPRILIGAHFRSYLIFAPIMALGFAYPIYHFLIKRQRYWLFSIVGFAAIYVLFLQHIPKGPGTALTWEFYRKQIFSLEWDRLVGSNGLFEFVTINMLWYITVLFQLIIGNNYDPVWKRICNSSFQYWAMILAGIIVSRFSLSSEAKTLTVNVFLLYVFLQQSISIQNILIFNKKIKGLLIRQII